MSERKKRRLPWPDVPEPRREIMRANRRRDSGPERELRSVLHRRGLRFRVDHPIKAGDNRAIRPDVVFPRQRLAVFVDGCFWHGCPVHGTWPATNKAYWAEKIARNQDRDLSTTAALEADGWTVLRFWEHDDAAASAERVAQVLGAHSSRGG